MKRILVTGAGGSAGANFVDALRRAPEALYLVGTDTNKYHLELAPGLDKAYILPPASDESYLEQLNELLGRERIELVHAQPDVEVRVLSTYREATAAKVFLPSKEAIDLCQDKMALQRRLKDRAVSTPESYPLESEADLRTALKRILAKHELAWIRTRRGMGSRGALPVRTFSQASAWIAYWQEMKGVGYGHFMISEFLPGKEYAWQSLWQNGRLVTSMARERMEYLWGHLTPSGQTSTPSVAKTVHRQEVNELGTQAVRAVEEKPNGVFCVDIRENCQAVACVTEINAGRFFTTSNFSAHAGCNMPYLYVLTAFGDEMPPVKTYNPVEEGWYWIRMVDMGYKLIKGERWLAQEVERATPPQRG